MFRPPFRPGSRSPLAGGLLCLAIGLVGCNQRERLTFPNAVNGVGPKVVINNPSQDTTVTAGPAALIAGKVFDEAGIDTVYFDVQGGLAGFPPFVADGILDTMSFVLPVTTNGLAGSTITVSVFGTNLAGTRGDTVSRRITVQ
jgi:hypothetical protein